MLDFLKGEGADLLLLKKSLASSKTDAPPSLIGSSTVVSVTQIEDEAKDQDMVDSEDTRKAADHGSHPKASGNVQDDTEMSEKAHQEPELSDGSEHKLKTSEDTSQVADAAASSAKAGERPDGTKVVQLERMFRRASLDHVNALFPGVLVPSGESIATALGRPEDSDRKQFHARGA